MPGLGYVHAWSVTLGNYLLFKVALSDHNLEQEVPVYLRK